MDRLEVTIKEKLQKFNLPHLEILDKKTQVRLLQIENAIEGFESESKVVYEQLRNLKLNKSLIVNSEHIKFSRKTIYNDKLLNEYIESSIRNSEDYFNEKQINKLSEDLNEFKQLYDNVLCNIINTLVLENELSEVKDTVKNLKNRNEKLISIITEKEEIIRNLQNGNNVIPFKKE